MHKGPPDMNKVDSLIVLMMCSYPSLYPTRADALKHLFCTHSCKWIDGHLVYRDRDELTPSGKTFSDEDAEISKYMDGITSDQMDDAEKRREEATVRMRVRRQNTERKFIIDNARYLAIELYSKLSYAPRNEFYRFDDMPSNAHPEWVDAAKELAYAVLEFKMGLPYLNQSLDYQTRTLQQIEEAKERCRAFLKKFVFGGQDESRATRLAKLRSEAKALGAEIIEN